MKIAVMAKMTTFHKGFGGLETQNRALCEGLAKKGHQVTVFSPIIDLSQNEIFENNIRYIFVKCIYRMGPIFGFFGTAQKSNWIRRSVEEFEKIHKDEKFEIVLAQSSTGLGIIKNKKRLKIKVISIAHGTIIGEYKTFVASMKQPANFFKFIKNTGFTIKNFFRRQRDFVHGSDKIIAVSNYVKQALIDETFTFDEKITVIKNGIDPALFCKDKQKQRGNNVLYVGQINKSKGVFDLLEMSKSEILKNTRFDLAGGGDDFEDLSQKIKNDNFKLVGKFAYEDLVSKYYLNEDYGVFVLPTKRYEGLPMVLVEAMFSGLPIVAYNMGGVGDAVEDGINGFLVKENDSNKFIERIKVILEDHNLRKKMSENAVSKAYKEFCLSDMIEKYEQVIKEVLS